MQNVTSVYFRIEAQNSSQKTPNHPETRWPAKRGLTLNLYRHAKSLRTLDPVLDKVGCALYADLKPFDQRQEVDRADPQTPAFPSLPI